MATIDLSSYNLGELKGLQFEIEKEIKTRQQQAVRNAREQILAIAWDAGMSVDDLLGKANARSTPGSRAKGQPRYRNPADNSQTWTGRGRQPRWIAEGLANGKTLDEFRI